MAYNTKQRENILEYFILNKDKHITADNIISYFKEKGSPIGKATVYRCLDKFVEENMVRKYTIEDGISACYQYIEKNHDCKNHYHFKCTTCNKLFHVDCEHMADICGHIKKEHNFEIDNSKTVFYGKCEECRKKED